MRVLTYNIHKGFCFYSRQYVLAELRESVRAVNADLVFLQEVTGTHPAKARVDFQLESQLEYLAHELWDHTAYGKNAIYSNGHHGNAILSKFPIAQVDNINVSTNSLEKRGLLHARVPVAGQVLHLVCLHLNLTERGRKRQMMQLIDHTLAQVGLDEPLIIAGDFNDWQRNFSDILAIELGLMESGVMFNGQHALTFPSWHPLLPLDRVYVRCFRVLDYKVLSGPPWSRMSDHAAVMVDIELAATRPVRRKKTGAK